MFGAKDSKYHVNDYVLYKENVKVNDGGKSEVNLFGKIININYIYPPNMHKLAPVYNIEPNIPYYARLTNPDKHPISLNISEDNILSGFNGRNASLPVEKFNQIINSRSNITKVFPNDMKYIGDTFAAWDYTYYCYTCAGCKDPLYKLLDLVRYIDIPNNNIWAVIDNSLFYNEERLYYMTSIEKIHSTRILVHENAIQSINEDKKKAREEKKENTTMEIKETKFHLGDFVLIEEETGSYKVAYIRAIEHELVEYNDNLQSPCIELNYKVHYPYLDEDEEDKDNICYIYSSEDDMHPMNRLVYNSLLTPTQTITIEELEKHDNDRFDIVNIYPNQTYPDEYTHKYKRLDTVYIKNDNENTEYTVLDASLVDKRLKLPCYVLMPSSTLGTVNEQYCHLIRNEDQLYTTADDTIEEDTKAIDPKKEYYDNVDQKDIDPIQIGDIVFVDYNMTKISPVDNTTEYSMDVKLIYKVLEKCCKSVDGKIVSYIIATNLINPAPFPEEIPMELVSK